MSAELGLVVVLGVLFFTLAYSIPAIVFMLGKCVCCDRRDPWNMEVTGSYPFKRLKCIASARASDAAFGRWHIPGTCGGACK